VTDRGTSDEKLGEVDGSEAAHVEAVAKHSTIHVHRVFLMSLQSPDGKENFPSYFWYFEANTLVKQKA
jgi:hypothetical protein